MRSIHNNSSMFLQISNGNHALEVHQFHYTVWPDHGVPECGTPLLSFHSRVEKFFKRDSAPMVIHCSAGVGRTGTFIVIDTQMQRIRDQSNIDIFNNVRRLRFCRNYMVQTQVNTYNHICNCICFGCGHRASTVFFMMLCWRQSCAETHRWELLCRILWIVYVIWLLWTQTQRRHYSQNSLRSALLFLKFN